MSLRKLKAIKVVRIYLPKPQEPEELSASESEGFTTPPPQTSPLKKDWGKVMAQLQKTVPLVKLNRFAMLEFLFIHFVATYNYFCDAY